MKRKWLKKMIVIGLTMAVSLVGAAGCGKSDKSSDTDKNGKEKLSFWIWDTEQEAGMKAMCQGYMEQHPDVDIEVQVIGWSEYWTKLEASANAGTLPDLFWMHLNKFGSYASNGYLADTTDLFKDIESDYYTAHFPEGLVENAKFDDKIYGVPKDCGTNGLVYNKDIFDQAELEYPDDTWTWDDLEKAAKTIKEKTGTNGFLATYDNEVGYYDLVYQAGGHIINADKTKSGWTDPATQMAMDQWVEWQKADYTPDMSVYAETDEQSLFVGGQAGMMFLGNWYVPGFLKNYPDLNFDVVELPACPNPASGTGEAVIYNGLTYATSEAGKNKETALDVLKYLGSEEAMKIQGESGAAIPAYIGTESTWTDQVKDQVNAEVFVDMMEHGVPLPYSISGAKWNTELGETMRSITNEERTTKEAWKHLQEFTDECLDGENTK